MEQYTWSQDCVISFLYTNCVINAFQHDISWVIFYRKSTFSEQRIIRMKYK